ncbi:MAG: neutral/alkaline non-lysosomal ceramidase N-terminal domain-containing protein [Myxococcota bacterium]
MSRAPPDEPFVALLANGHEGDVSPAYETQGFAEARRLGERLGDRVLRAHGRLGDGMAATTVGVAYGEADLPHARVQGTGSLAGGRLCLRPELGTAAFGGTEDGRTSLALLPPFREGRGTRRWTDHCQSPKRSILFGVARWVLNEWSMPKVAPMHVVRIGEAVVATVPGEMTTTGGLRLRRRLARRTGVDRVAIVGLANGYLQYITTAAEYSAQHYEGASTLYGPWTWGFFADRLTQLAGALDGDPLGDDWERDRVRPGEVRPGRSKARGRPGPPPVRPLARRASCRPAPIAFASPRKPGSSVPSRGR